MSTPNHFLDLDAIDAVASRRIVDLAARAKAGNSASRRSPGAPW